MGAVGLATPALRTAVGGTASRRRRLHHVSITRSRKPAWLLQQQQHGYGVSHASTHRGEDALGGQDFIYSQRSGVEETLFKGSVLGVDADVSTGDLRVSELRSFGNIVGDFHVPQRFRDRFTVHIAKNLLTSTIGIS
jgi:hypothetical protein